MSISYAILGILSYKPLTGYDLKKIIQSSSFMPWSGNNNQIYKSLVELLEEGSVINEVQHQESSPSKKIYTITEEGLVKLKKWVFSSPDPLEFKKPFLVQLAWADQLSAEELNDLLSRYEYEIKMQILSHQEKKRRGSFSPERTPREKLIWDMIDQNIVSSYENELEWVSQLRREICGQKEEDKIMNYAVISRGNKTYIKYTCSESPIHTEQEAMDLVAACIENDTNLVMIDSEALSDDFFRLGTGLAGGVLQKFANYRIKAVVAISDKEKIKGKFKELMAESNKGNSFRLFDNQERAEEWLIY